MNIVITYETFIKNIKTFDFKCFQESNIEIYLTTKLPKIKKYKIWFFCISNGIYPKKIFTSSKLFKEDIYSYRDVCIFIRKNEIEKHIIFITDDVMDYNIIRDLRNITIQSFYNFNIYVKEQYKKSIKPFV